MITLGTNRQISEAFTTIIQGFQSSNTILMGEISSTEFEISKLHCS